MQGRITAAAAAAALLVAAPAYADDRDQSTQLISRSLDGGMPNAPSTNAVISNDKRYARVIAFESEASDLVPGDTNGVKDVFAVKRTGKIGNNGSAWKAGSTVLVSRTAGGEPANGPSYSPSVDGAFRHKPSCVGFLSQASNLVAGDTNGKADAFVAKIGKAPQRISLPGGQQSGADTTQVAVSGDCKLAAFVTDGKLYVWKRGKVKQIPTNGTAADPSFSTGLRNDLVFGATGGAYLSSNGTGRPKLIAPGGRNPAFNDIKRRTVTYETTVHGRTQIGYRDVGKREQIISARGNSDGNANSRKPVIGNSGFYVTFESDASNLGVNALGRTGDGNGETDVYLFTDVRDITLVQSVERKAEPVPGGGQNPSMSFYANYIVFDSPAGLDSPGGPHQVYMRYLGPV